MIDNLIQFDKLKWVNIKEGVEQKIYSNGNRKIRLVRFYDNFMEKEWCTNGHIGFVLRGEMKINFDGTIKSYKQGDGLWIEAGEKSKHKVLMDKGKQVELVLFEEDK